jgi:hypothetical protein
MIVNNLPARLSTLLLTLLLLLLLLLLTFHGGTLASAHRVRDPQQAHL